MKTIILVLVGAVMIALLGLGLYELLDWAMDSTEALWVWQ